MLTTRTRCMHHRRYYERDASQIDLERWRFAGLTALGALAYYFLGILKASLLFP